jgi:hypothetical protein
VPEVFKGSVILLNNVAVQVGKGHHGRTVVHQLHERLHRGLRWNILIVSGLGVCPETQLTGADTSKIVVTQPNVGVLFKAEVYASPALRGVARVLEKLTSHGMAPTHIFCCVKVRVVMPGVLQETEREVGNPSSPRDASHHVLGEIPALPVAERRAGPAFILQLHKRHVGAVEELSRRGKSIRRGDDAHRGFRSDAGGLVNDGFPTGKQGLHVDLRKSQRMD